MQEEQFKKFDEFSVNEAGINLPPNSTKKQKTEIYSKEFPVFVIKKLSQFITELENKKDRLNKLFSEKEYKRKGREEQKKLVKNVLELLSFNEESFNSSMRAMHTESNLTPHYKHHQVLIDLDNELNTDKLQWDKKKYYFKTEKERWAKHGATYPSRVISENSPEPVGIYIKRVDGKFKRYSLPEFYKTRVGSISRATINSKDLLDNILVLYTIKRAQRGDEQAFDIIYGQYIKSVEKAAKYFVYKRLNKMGLEADESGSLGDKNIEVVAGEILKTLIRGDHPLRAMEMINKKADVYIAANRKLGVELIKFSEKKLPKIYDKCIIFAEKQIKNLKKRAANLNWELKKGSAKGQKEKIKIALVNYSYKTYKEFYQKTGLFFRTSTDTAQWILATPKFNNFLFVPDKRTNFTVWLFGSSKVRGAFFQRLHDWYKGNEITHTEKGILLIRPEHLKGARGKDDFETKSDRSTYKDWRLEEGADKDKINDDDYEDDNDNY
ncbi:MAG: hypothetical protein ABSF55_03050 [Candidatus Staskawiczbacteria bacterium]